MLLYSSENASNGNGGVFARLPKCYGLQALHMCEIGQTLTVLYGYLLAFRGILLVRYTRAQFDHHHRLISTARRDTSSYHIQ